MANFKKGDIVKQKGKSPFMGLKGKPGVIVKTGDKPYRYYKVRIKGKGILEFHGGELTKARKKRKRKH